MAFGTSIGLCVRGGRGRVSLLALAFAGAAILPGGAAAQGSSPSPPKYAGVTLRVANCCGVWNKATSKGADERFEAATGAKLAYTEAYAQQLAPQVIAAGGKNPPYDVVFTDDQTQTQLAELGLIEKYDPNTLKMAAEVTLPPLNKGYPPGTWLYYVGIAYNTEKFREQGIPAPKSWSDLWNPKLAGHIDIPALTTPQGVPFIVAASAVAGSDPYNLTAGVHKIAELKVYTVYKSSAQYQSDLSTGNAWAAVVADGRAWQLVDAGKPIQFVLPEVPGMGKKGFVARAYVDIVRGTSHPELAKIYQQLASDATTQISVALAAGYSPTLASAIREIVSKDPKWGERWPAPHELANIAPVDWPRVLPQLQQTTDLFSRTVGR
jgi:putative spermidine/putrescine transport system substrate-binding protein